jgi:hypothetical protein
MLCLNFKNPSTMTLLSLCLIKKCGSREEMITFFHQLDSMNLSFESIEDNLIIDRSK